MLSEISYRDVKTPFLLYISVPNRKPTSINPVKQGDVLLTDFYELSCSDRTKRPLPVQVRLQKRQLPSNFYGVQSHQVQGLAVPNAPDVPLDGGRRALKGDVVTDPICLSFLSFDDFSN